VVFVVLEWFWLGCDLGGCGVWMGRFGWVLLCVVVYFGVWVMAVRGLGWGCWVWVFRVCAALGGFGVVGVGGGGFGWGGGCWGWGGMGGSWGGGVGGGVWVVGVVGWLCFVFFLILSFAFFFCRFFFASLFYFFCFFCFLVAWCCLFSLIFCCFVVSFFCAYGFFFFCWLVSLCFFVFGVVFSVFFV